MERLEIIRKSDYLDESGTHVIEASLNRAPTDAEMQGLKEQGFNAFRWANGEAYPIEGAEDYVPGWSAGQTVVIWLFWLGMGALLLGFGWLVISGFSCVIDIYCLEWLR